MSSKTSIEWTEHTWNPVAGCTKISPGCKHCYAETMAVRLKAMGVRGYENGFKLSLVPERLNQPLERKKPTTFFVNSMSDLFHESVPFDYIDKVFDVMRLAEQHTFQVLTKRADRMANYLETAGHLPPHIWVGVSVEDIKYGIPRIDPLRNTPAVTRFLSIEPLLEDLGEIDLTGIHWVIVGGESGSKSRIMKPEWVENIQYQCLQSNVPFFFKQWGNWGVDGVLRNKKINGRLLHGQTWDEMPIISGNSRTEGQVRENIQKSSFFKSKNGRTETDYETRRRDRVKSSELHA